MSIFLPVRLPQINPARLLKAGQASVRLFSATAQRLLRYQNLPLLKLPGLRQDLFQRTKPIMEYMGQNPSQATFQQGKIHNCYLHATVDATQHHRLFGRLLSRIRVGEVKDKTGGVKAYDVYFPGCRPQKVEEREIGLAKDGYEPVRGHKGFQMLELAYAKLVSRFRNRKPEFAPVPYPNEGRDHALALVGCGLPSEAMANLFVGHRLTRFTRGHENPKSLARIVKNVGRDKQNNYLLCAITQEEGMGGRVFQLPPKLDGSERQIKAFTPFHSYSIRAIHPDDTVTIADPHDTANRVERLTLEEFGQVFTCVDGIRFKKHFTPAQPVRTVRLPSGRIISRRKPAE